MSYKLGSLFDGSGGFPLVGSLNGIEPVWAAEVEPYPIAVTTSRFPKMKHLGDITKINGAEVEPVDIVSFGSPCQDLSSAGLRKGLRHEENGDDETTRSGLFMEVVRIIKEMRKVTNGQYPRFAVWENVPGAFSSNDGEDFRIVLQELIKIAEPNAVMPEVPKKGWAYADSYCGDGWSIAYRVFDAQFWGVPQRRRRIYLVADFRGECAEKILFERESVRGYFAESGTPWQTITPDAQGSIGTDDRDGAVCYGISSYDSNSMKSSNPNSGIYEADTSRTLDGNGGNPSCNQGGIAIVETRGPGAVAYSMGITMQDSRGVGSTISETMPTLTSGTCPGYQNGVVISQPIVGVTSGAQFTGKFTNTAETLRARDYKKPQCVVDPRSRHYIVRRLTPTECARLQGFPDKWGHLDPKTKLTDDEYRFWLEVRKTHDAINGRTVKDYNEKQMLTYYNKLWTDSAEYKMWGNGIALPCALYVMQGIKDALVSEQTARSKWLDDLLRR